MNDLLPLWTRHAPELRRWLRTRLPVPAEADDLLQDVLVKALRHGAEGWAAVAQPRAWLFEVTRNTLIDRLRSGRDSHPLPDDLDQWAAPDDTADAVDALAQACLPRVLAELDPQDREAIELCDLQGMAQADYAALKHLSLPAAKSRVQRARRRMREHMTSACQVRFDDAGCVEDFVPRPALASPCCPVAGPPSHDPTPSESP
ncbi:sigma-70 family RNA polymerase sigma factor [Hydrogenophaga sp.]|uniref:sigma-70 family RNA polymerase sigma factor n=1 Tax=Hydrogenophaga sp. TaxID=1904254 RepID=UPI00286E5243|nr:sigma-70 family RNA polymerase sigma factor [Hydrogenophaga sp.]